MKKRALQAVSIGVLALMVLSTMASILPVAVADGTVIPDHPTVTQQQVLDAVVKGLDWFTKNQFLDGSWAGSVGVTGLVVMCFTNAGYDYTNTTVQKALGHMRNFYNPVEGTLADSYLNYETAISLIAMGAAGDPQDADKLSNMAEFFEVLQFSDDSTYSKTEPWFHGGWPNYAGIPDVSNCQFALLGLQAAELLSETVTIPEKVWTNITTFMNHCQNIPEINQMPWAHNESLPSYDDGGFVYNAYRSRTELGEQMFESYGSITAAGYYSYLVSGNDERQPEVAAARSWMEREYTLDVNPRMVGKGLYYYLWTQTRALAMSGQDWVVDGSGKLRDWRAEVADLFIDLQLSNGGWPGNPQTGWREEEPEVAGIYALLSMQIAHMIAPEPELELQVSGGTTVRFVSSMGEELVDDATKGLSVTSNSLTCTDPEVFRKIWVVVEGSEGSEATVSATGTWGEDRTSSTSKTVELGKGGASVHVSSGAFAGPFGIHMMAYERAPVMEVDGPHTLRIKKGETRIVSIELVETTGEGPIVDATLVIPVESGIVADVDTQSVYVPAGGTGTLDLTISVKEDAKISKDWHMVVTSATAPPKVIKIVQSADDDVSEPSTIYWVLIGVLAVVVIIFIAIPGFGRKDK
jgi:squalene-hopene/tetraprenyl-beta-curcumene cyclase